MPEDPFRSQQEWAEREVISKDFVAYGVVWPLLDYIYEGNWRENGPIDELFERTDYEDDDDERNPAISVVIIADRTVELDEANKPRFYSDVSLLIDKILEDEIRDEILEYAVSDDPSLAWIVNTGFPLLVKRSVAYGFGTDGSNNIFTDTEITTENAMTLWRPKENATLQGDRHHFDHADLQLIEQALRNFKAPQELFDALATIRFAK